MRGTQLIQNFLKNQKKRWFSCVVITFLLIWNNETKTEGYAKFDTARSCINRKGSNC
jgi:hypothetical protein